MLRGSLIGVMASLLLTLGTTAQILVPGGPKRMTPRPTGGGTPGGVSINSADTGEQKVRYTTHLVLAESRQWTSTDGRTLQAKLIAFEDLVVEAPKGAAQPSAPTPPATLTVVRNGKIRLVADQKPFELALDRLSQADREVVERIRAAQAKRPAAPTQ